MLAASDSANVQINEEHIPHTLSLQEPTSDPRLGFVPLFSRKQNVLMIQRLRIKARMGVAGVWLS